MALTKVSGPLLHGSNDNLGNYVINNITGAAATFTGNVSVGGTLTYDDVTNVDSVGIVTARGGLHVGVGGTIIHALSEDDGKVGIASAIPSEKLDVIGNIKASGTITGSSFVGALPISSDGNNRVITATGSGGLNGESNLTFDGSTLILTGDLTFGNSPSYDIQLQGGKIYGEDNAANSLHLQSTSGNNNHSRIEIGTSEGSDNGGIHFYTAGSSVAERRITIKGTSGRVGINSISPTGDLDVVGSGTSTISTILINAITHNTSKASEAVLKFGYAHSGSPHARGHIKMVEQSTNSFDADIIFGLPTNNSSGGSTTVDDLVRITPLMGTQLTRGSQGGRAHTGNTSNWMKIGTWNNILQQSRLKITVFGTTTYDSNANVAGETVIYISSNANYTLKGHFHSILHGISKRNGVQKVALKYDASTTPTSCEVWIKYNGSYSTTYHLADASTGYWVGADVNTNSTDTPSGAEEIFSSYSIALSDGTQSDVRVAISSEGNIGIGTHDPQAPVHIDGGTTGTQRLRVQNHASVGTFSGNYGSEFRHATSSANHCMLIHCQEANDDRRTLDISDANGVFAQFTNGKFGVGTAGNDAGHPTRDVEICSPDGGILRISSSDDSLGANERLGAIEFHTDDDDGGHVGAAITAIADPSDSFGRRTALLFGTQNSDSPPADAVERLRITAAGTVAVVSNSFALGSPGENVSMQTVTKRGFLGAGSNATLSVGTAYAGGRIVAHAYKTSDSTKQTTYYADFQARGTGNGFRTNERTVVENSGVNYSVTDATKGFKITNNESFTIKYAMMIEIVGDIPVG